MLDELVERFWYRSNKLKYLLLPLCLPFLAIITLRKFYLQHIWPNKKLSVPVIIVGNITVGGTGKTPFVCSLVDALKKNGYHPGVISRGYGRQSHDIQEVFTISSPFEVGDEPLVIAQNARCPIFVGKKRYDVAKALLAQHPEVNVVISDDGLQHYALPRDIEIILIDRLRKFGNKLLLPFGPLREPISRINSTEFIVDNLNICTDSVVVNLKDTTKKQPLSVFKKVHAVAGIAHPAKFFKILNQNNLNYIGHVFKDHYNYKIEDISFNDNLDIIMTQKDAVKVACLALQKNIWYLPIQAELNHHFIQKLLNQIRSKHGS